MALYSTAALEAGALSVGGLVAAHLLDVTGVFAASSLALVGVRALGAANVIDLSCDAAAFVSSLQFLVLPQRAAQQKAHFRVRVRALQQKLDEALAKRFEREMHKIQEAIMRSIDPYARFVRVENSKLGEMQHTFERIQETTRRLRLEVS